MSSRAELEVRDHEKQLRDVVALSTLPAIWLGAEPMRVAESLVAALFTTVGVQFAYVGLKGPDQEIYAAATTGRNEPSPSLAAELGPSILEWARDHEPDEFMQATVPIRDEALYLSVRPLAFGAECGAIAIGFKEGDPPTSFQHLLVNVAATQATIAVQNIHLLRSLRQNIAEREESETRERQANEELETIHGVSRSLTGELDLKNVINGFTDAATRLSGAQYGAFFYNVKDGEHESYSLYALSGAPRQAFEKLGMPRNSELFDSTFRGTAVVRLADVWQDTRYGKSPPHFGLPAGHVPVRSYLAVPVVSRQREVLGGLFLGHPDCHVFTERSERLAVGIAAYAAVAIDNARLYGRAQEEIAQREHAVETQRLLIGELNHRVKNTLATVQAIANQTLRHANSQEDFVASFSGRIQALARVHTVLTDSNWRGTDLQRLFAEQLSVLDADSVVASGPEVHLDPQMALHFAIVLHELSTNSQKYGALSTGEGSVTATWTQHSGQLFLRWVEAGGPPVATLPKPGFGSKLIQQSIKSHGGNAQMIQVDGGIKWEITVPMPLAPPSTTQHEQAAAAPSDKRRRANAIDRTDTSVLGKRILVVEDEALVSVELVDSLTMYGIEAIGPSASVEDAMEVIGSTTLDGALVDANLNGRAVHEITAALVRCNIPFALVTGYTREDLPKSFREYPLVAKPCTGPRVIEAIQRMLSVRGSTEGELAPP
jgi:two-component sensor histidine kinase